MPPGPNLVEVNMRAHPSIRRAARLLYLLGIPVAAVALASCSPDIASRPQPPRAAAARPQFPREIQDFRYRQRLSADGTMPTDALMRARRQRDALIASTSQPEVGGLSRGGWRWLGPDNVGGRLRAILIHPLRTDTIWVGSVSGGIWKSENGGATWRPLDDFLASLAIGCMAMDPLDPDVLYAGTGEGFLNGDAVRGAGIFRSANGGATWQRLPATAPAPGATQWEFVNRIAIDPTDSTKILAATRGGVYRSADRGASWTQQTAVRALDVKFDPSDGTFAVASETTGTTGDGRALHSRDGGLTWTAATGLPADNGRIELCYSQMDPGTVFASVVRLSGGIQSTHGLYVSIDRGQSYAARNTSVPYLDNQGDYDNALWVDPTDVTVRRLVVGGVDLWRSTDGGVTLTKISDWARVPDPGDSAHADQHVIVHHPGYDGSSNGTVFVGNDGGIYRTPDITTATTMGWGSLNQGLGITQFFGAAANPTTGAIVGGTQDNASLRFQQPGRAWTAVALQPGGARTGDGGRCAALAGDPGVFFGEYPWLTVFRSSDGGLTSRLIHAGIGDANMPGRSNPIAPLVLDPNDGNRLIAGGRSLWRSDDAQAPAPQWRAIKPPTSFPSLPISAIAVAQGDSDVVWVGHNNGEVYKTANGTAPDPTWIEVDVNPPGLPNRFCSAIAIDRKDHDLVWVTFMGFEPDNVWRTRNGGQSWQLRNGGGALPSIPVSSIALHRTEPDWAYIGTDLGVFASADGGATWSSTTDGPANVVVDEVVWKDDRTLLAVTHGRGVFEADVGPSPVPVPGRTTRVSVSTASVQGDASSVAPQLSADGRFVAFTSNARTLVPGDTNNASDVFVHDRLTERTTRVSVPTVGSPFTQASAGAGFCSISADGRHVAFDSQSTNLLLVPDRNFTAVDVFVHDRQTGTTELVSKSSTGEQGNTSSAGVSISPNARYVAFESSANNLVPNDTNNVKDVFVHDRRTGTTTRISEGPGGQEADRASSLPWVADNGAAVFLSDATNLVTRDTNNARDVFLYQPGAGVRRVNVSTSGQQAGAATFGWPRISADGRVVAFDSVANDLVSGDTNGRQDVFVHDLQTGETTRVSVSSAVVQGNLDSSKPSLSTGGRFVAFASNASNLVPDDTNGRQDAFVHDRQTGMTARVSVSSTGAEGDNHSGGSHPILLSVSSDGRLVAFQSLATNLVPGDTNGVSDVFVHDAFPVVATTDRPGIGKRVGMNLHSPDDAGRPYFLASSLGTTPGIPIGNRTIPLNPDGLFFASWTNPAIFEGYVGVLDGSGSGQAALHIPSLPALVGVTIHTGLLSYDPAAPFGIRTISLPLALTFER